MDPARVVWRHSRWTGVLVGALGGSAACTPAGDDDGSETASDTEPDATDADPHTDGVDSDVDAGPASVVTWVAGDEVVCPSPGDRLNLGWYEAWTPPGFTPEDQDWRLDDGAFFHGGGVAVGDLNGDGRIDLVRGTDGRSLAVYLQGEEGFTRGDDGLPEGMPDRIGAVVPVDLEGDGDLDLFVGGWEAPDAMLINDGAGTFVDVATARGLAGPSDARTVGASFADADGDGDLDVAIAVHGEVPTTGTLPPGQPSRVLLQGDDGTFTDLVPDRPDDDPLQVSHAFLSTWLELDGTPGLELYTVHDFGWRVPNAAYDLVDGALVRLPALGIESTATNMGLGVGDLDGDGRVDLAVPAIDRVFLYRSQGDRWFDVSISAGVVPDIDGGQRVGWGAELADLDHDGDLDLPVVFGYLDERAQSGPNRGAQADALWVQQDGRYRERAEEHGVDTTHVARGLVVADVDGDGWLDLVKGNLAGPTRISRARCGRAHWVAVRLDDTVTANRHGLGGVVEVHVGETVQRRYPLAGGTGYAGGGPSTSVFGLDEAEAIDAIVVRWPDGGVDRVEPAGVDRTITVQRRPVPTP